MTEEKLDQARQSAAIGRVLGLFLAALGILALALWLLRQPIAEFVARSICND
jgi:flagellar biogenesis protein FliO